MQVALPNAVPTLIGVVADTHSSPHPDGLRHLAALKPHLVLHAGDIGDLHVLEQLRAIAPLQAVRGNIDDASSGLPETQVLEFERDGRRVLTALLTHIAVYGGIRIRGEVAKAARAASAQLIVCGHSHVPFITQDRGLTLFNPGSVGPKRPPLPILFGVIEIGAQGISMRHVDALTGAKWLPP
ncbi:MAG: metallophosphoesterase family protein [Archangiaceae bacterium]|nr:metallophosphoesterase family protein [Archangiaceae bacterium]